MTEGQLNPPPSDRAVEYSEAFLAKYPDGNLSQLRITNVIEMLAAAINEAGSATDVVAVASALEGMEFDSLWGTKIYMRPQDHQLIQNVHIMAHTDEGVTFDYDRSGFGVVVESTVEMASADIPTTCEMERP